VHTLVPGVVLLPVLVEQADGTSTVQDVMAIDAKTGRNLWRERGEPAYGDERGLMLTDWNPAANLVTRLRMIRPSDGTELWSFTPSDPVTSWTASGGSDPNRPEWFATVTDTGKVELRHTADGSLMARGKVPWLVSRVDEGKDDYAYLGAAAGVLFSVRQRDGTQTMSAFDVTTMRQIWTWTGDGRGGTFDCGPLVCLGNQPGVEAVDPATGKRLWSSPGWDYARPLGATRMLYESHRDNSQGVLDVRTGKILITFPQGSATVDAENADVLLLRFTAETPADLAVYRLRGDELQLRGRMGGSTDQGCQFANSRLVCLMGSGSEHELVVKAVG
jgi:outer membrane protein assembly factor BamB